MSSDLGTERTAGVDVADAASDPPVAVRHSAHAWAAAVLVPIIAAAVMFAVVARLSDRGDGDMAQHSGVGPAAAPLDLASVTPEIAANFTYAKAHPAGYSAITCYCGCQEYLGHRNLFDCFVRSDGKGWDAHAAGCGVCLVESITARRLADQGHSAAEVRDAIDTQFGATPRTVPQDV